jgi:hypothetical protein
LAAYDELAQDERRDLGRPFRASGFKEEAFAYDDQVVRRALRK